jgi:hypothetical protein
MLIGGSTPERAKRDKSSKLKKRLPEKSSLFFDSVNFK